LRHAFTVTSLKLAQRLEQEPFDEAGPLKAQDFTGSSFELTCLAPTRSRDDGVWRAQLKVKALHWVHARYSDREDP
jgi:hypothetical protein